MMRWKHGFIILLCVVLSALYVFPSFADEWVLGEVRVEDDYTEDYIQDYSVASGSDATASNATRSNADYGIMLLSNHDPYDNGSISTSIVTYMSDVIPKLGNVHYVLFRAGQYDYRLYYSKELEYDGSGGFTASRADYIAYDSRYYTWNYGTESNFGLDAGSVMVYSDLGQYPMLSSGETSTWLLVALGAVYFLFVLLRSFFSPSKMTI